MKSNLLTDLYCATVQPLISKINRLPLLFSPLF